MIRKGSKVQYITDFYFSSTFEKDAKEFNGIFEVIGVSKDMVFVKSKYNEKRSEETYVRGLETDNERYWCIGLNHFKEYNEIIEFDKELDVLFEF